MDELQVGLTPDERRLCRAALDNPTDVNLAFCRLQRSLGLRQEEYWAEGQAAIPGSAYVLAAWPIEHDHVSVRFLAFDSAPKRGADGAGSFWFVSGYLGHTRSGEVLTHLAFECEEDGEPLTSDVVRSFRLPEIAAKVKAVIETNARRERILREIWGVPDMATLEALEQAARDARQMELRRGRAGFPDRYYQGLAFDYLREAERGRGALLKLGALYGQKRQTIRDHLSRAKARGFLQGGQPGRLSYQAGPRLYPPPQGEGRQARTTKRKIIGHEAS